MKFSVAFLLVFSWISIINGSPVRQTRSLDDDLNDFLELLPLESILPVIQEYVANDKEIQHVIEYMKTEEFKDLVRLVDSNESVLSFLEYLHESGLDVHTWVNAVNDFLGLPPLYPQRLYAITGGMAGLVGDIESLLPFEKIKALYYEKLEKSEDFKKLIDRLHSPELQKLVDELLANKEVQHIVDTLKSSGVDVKAIAELVTKILGIEFPGHNLRRSARSLQDDFEDFVALVPLDKVIPIVQEYLQNDAEVKHIVEYAKSKEFRDLVESVESIDDVLNFYNYLQESGLDIYEYVNLLHQTIGLPPLHPPKISRSTTGGIAGLVADVKAVLPLDKFAALYEEKLKTSAEFKNLVDRLKSPKFQAIVDKVVQNEEFVHIISKAREYGINVDAVADVISTLLGVKFPHHRVYNNARALHNDLEDFLALVPQEEVTEIFQEYLVNDKEVQAAFEYIQGAEFRQLVKVVESIDDVINFYNYLQEAGLDIYGAVNQLHDVIGLPHLKPKRSFFTITGGISGLIQDIKNVLPIDKIKALYYEKLEESPEFKNLVDKLHSPKFQAVVDTLRANPEFQEIVKAAKKAGVDVVAVTDLLTTIFGLQFPPVNSRKVRDIEAHLEDFFFLLPIEKIAEISVTFMANDPEVQEAVRYVQSEEFKNLLVKLQQEKDIQNVMKYIHESGLDVYTLIDFLNDVLGVPHFPRPFLRTRSFALRTRETTGVHGMLNAIRKVIPYEDIHAMYQEKLESSEDFRLFIEHFRAPEFQAHVDKLVVNEVFVELGHQAYLHGIDIKKISDFLQELLGIKLPQVPFEKSLSREAASLSDDLMDFLDILPVDSLVKTTLTYAFNDKETQQAIQYMRSEAFKNIVRELDRIPEYIQILQELDAAGLDVYHWIQIFHRFIGFDDHIPFFRASVLGKPGISGLIEELKKLLPHEQIKELYYEKLETSAAFANFVNLVKSDKFQTVTNDLFENKDFQYLLREAQKHGVDLQKVADFFLRVFGIITPSGVIEP